MAQTRTITRKKLAALGALDLVARTLHAVYKPPPRREGRPRSFLVIEPWGIGDVVLSTVALKALRANFPDASITLLAKEHAKELLRHSGLADEVVVFDFPWTSFSRKFSPSRYDRGKLKELIARLRSCDFDVSLDARRDIRSNVVAYLAGARRRVGYDFGGGAHLLTDVLPSGLQNEHKTADWLALLAPLGLSPRDVAPSLVVSAEESERARQRLSAMGLSADLPLIGVHPGASHGVRRWGGSRFAEVIDELGSDARRQFLLFEHVPEGSADIRPRHAVTRATTQLREFMALVSHCDLLLCSDSGPMHIANALGVPVTALFGPQRSEWYGPLGANDTVVRIEEMPCRPCFDQCIFSAPRCMNGIRPDVVASAVEKQLARVARTHQLAQIS